MFYPYNVSPYLKNIKKKVSCIKYLITNDIYLYRN